MGKRKSRSNLRVPEPKIEVVEGIPPPTLPDPDQVPIPPPLTLDANNEPVINTKDRQPTNDTPKEPTSISFKKKKSLRKSYLKQEKKIQTARLELQQVYISFIRGECSHYPFLYHFSI
jgi:hypothetical protein